MSPIHTNAVAPNGIEPTQAEKSQVDKVGFRNWISNEQGSTFKPERDRYHLYVSWACPWAHRVLVTRALKNLEDIIPISVVDWMLTPDGAGWRFRPETPGATPYHIYGAGHLSELYLKADPEYKGRFTVPVLWDKHLSTIVSNESADILRILTSAFDLLLPSGPARDLDLYPESLRAEIDETNSWILDMYNSGVYKAGTATTQAAYEVGVAAVFDGLDRIEGILATKEFLCGLGTGVLTEADVRCWTTTLRFDSVYHTHFKCNLRTIARDYPNILRWARRIFQMDGVAATVNMTHIKHHYFFNAKLNPTQIVPVNNGPDFSSPIVKPGTVGSG